MKVIYYFKNGKNANERNKNDCKRKIRQDLCKLDKTINLPSWDSDLTVLSLNAFQWFREISHSHDQDKSLCTAQVSEWIFNEVVRARTSNHSTLWRRIAESWIPLNSCRRFTWYLGAQKKTHTSAIFLYTPSVFNSFVFIV